MMTPGARKLALMLHVLASVNWLGSVAAFLALAIAGLTKAVAVNTVLAVYKPRGLTRYGRRKQREEGAQRAA